MKLRIIENHDHRTGPALVQSFKAGTEVDVPKVTADALLKAGVAEKSQSKKGGTAHG